MKYIDEEDLLDDNFELSKYKIAEYINELREEIKQLKDKIKDLEENKEDRQRYYK